MSKGTLVLLERHKHLVLPALAVLGWLMLFPVFAGGQSTSAPTGVTTRPASPANCMNIDDDGDGYGVGCPLGPDADDSDPSVNTFASAMAKHGSVENLLAHLGYHPRRIYYVSPTGSDRMGVSNNIDRPWATFEHIKPLLRPGDVVIVRQGTYRQILELSNPPLKGTSDRPFVFMAMPGERAVIDSPTQCVLIGGGSWLILDGLVLDNSSSERLGQGVIGDSFHNVTMRNLESLNHYRGLIAMEDLRDVLVERCVIHDNPHTHGIYFGAREHPGQNVTIRNCRLYRNGYHGFQWNGRVTNLVVEDCFIHSNSLGGLSFLEGVSRSTIRNNVIFNNNRAGITFYLYDDPNPAAIQPFSQDDNLISNNTIWVGGQSWNKQSSPIDFPAIVFGDDTAAKNRGMSGNMIRHNILYTNRGETVDFRAERFARATTLVGNFIYRQAGKDKIVSVQSVPYALDCLGAVSPSMHDNTFANPQFARAQDSDAPSPERFDFRPSANAMAQWTVEGEKP